MLEIDNIATRAKVLQKVIQVVTAIAMHIFEKKVRKYKAVRVIR